MITETMARSALKQEFPHIIWQVEEFLSFADLTGKTMKDVEREFKTYMDK